MNETCPVPASSHPPASLLRFPETSPRAHAASLAGVARRLEEIAGQPRTLVVSLPAPSTEPERLLALSDLPDGFFWDPGAGAAVAGIGVAHRVEATGEERFDEVRRRAAEVWERLVVASTDPAAGRPLPRLYGGLAFTPGAAATAPWEEFGDAGFTLPRFLYRRTPAGASLTLAVSGETLRRPAARAACLAELAALLAALAEPAAPPAETRVTEIEPPPQAAWEEQVEAIRAAIRGGQIDKVVAAGYTRVELATPPALITVLRRLTDAPAFRFAFRRATTAFLGATPERLVSRHGRRVWSEALAGTAAVGASPEALLRSTKERHEHALVVTELRRRLAPFCTVLELPAVPQVRVLRHVQHLLTPLTGWLGQPPSHVLDLVAALHPTPAVAGSPTAEALAWIASHETSARGWYAAPVGWFDAAGDGEFAVALRSALVRGQEAYIYAGAGIVLASDPEREYVETALKTRTLLAALGAP